jgi:hypothetical protein
MTHHYLRNLPQFIIIQTSFKAELCDTENNAIFNKILQVLINLSVLAGPA